jgi:hypothetical protein
MAPNARHAHKNSSPHTYIHADVQVAVVVFVKNILTKLLGWSSFYVAGGVDVTEQTWYLKNGALNSFKNMFHNEQ